MINLAIVGAGIGGCSAAYFARKHLPNSKVTVYEKENRVGGRILTYHEGMKNEIGAAFMNSSNRTVCQLVKETGLEVEKLEEFNDIAVWNGTEITFKSSQPMFYKLLKLVTKYKLSVPKLLLMLREENEKLKTLYKTAEEKPAEFYDLFESVGLDRWHKARFDKILVEKGIDQKLIDELITPITRIIYSQNATLAGFAGLSALLGVYSEAVYNLKDGNDALPRKLLETSNAKVKQENEVTTVEKMSKGSFRVTAGDKTEVFDAVILATPLEASNIVVEGTQNKQPQTREYQKIYIRLMKGHVNPSYFNLGSTKLPSVILTTEQTDPITRFSISKSTKNNEHWVTVTSTEPITNGVLDGLFKNGATVMDHTWSPAYPVFKPTEKIPPTRLDTGLLYVNALESAVSSMETTTLAALNSVKTIKQQLSA